MPGASSLILPGTSSARRGLPSGARWTPASLSGLVLWLDAGLSPLFQNSNGTTAATADADPVGYWGDLSGAGNHATQATAGKRPTLKLAIVNGRAVLRGDGVDDFLRATFTMDQPFTRFSVLAMNTWTSGKQVFGGVSANIALYMATATPELDMYADSPGAGTKTTALAVGTFGVLTEVYNAASSSMQLNNGTAATGNPGGTGPGGITIMAQNSSVNSSAVDVAAIVMCSGALSASDRTLAARYLGARYGITVS